MIWLPVKFLVEGHRPKVEDSENPDTPTFYVILTPESAGGFELTESTHNSDSISTYTR